MCSRSAKGGEKGGPNHNPCPNESKLNRKHPWKVLYKYCSFSSDPLTNMVATGSSLWWPCLLMDRDKMSNLYNGSSIDASYHVSVHLAEGFQRRRLKCEKLTDDVRQVAKANRNLVGSSYRLWKVLY
jgi:hypothetical protein